jgi:hypothetical protein
MPRLLLGKIGMNRIALTLLFLVLCAGASFAGALKENSLSASTNGTNILVRWLSDDENGVLYFELERKAGNGQFVWLARVAPIGSNSSYNYTDDSAFRITDNIYQYRVRVFFSNGTSVTYGPIAVSHSVSSVRRTWGSIKAMFR